jgi:hypothetical protein
MIGIKTYLFDNPDVKEVKWVTNITQLLTRCCMI